MWIKIGIVVGLCILTLIVLMWYTRRKSDRHKKLPLPDEHGSAWSNNAIRKQGKAGKGIR